MNLQTLREANIKRQAEWCPGIKPDLSFRGNELGGECGEAQNVIKKLERERHGWKGSRDTVKHLAEELADLIIVSDLIALQCNINLGKAVQDKFNATSEKVGLQTKIQQDALQSLSAKLPDEEVKRIAKDTSYWISCIDGIDRTIRIKAAIEQAIHSALSLVHGGDAELMEDKRIVDHCIESGDLVHFEIWDKEEQEWKVTHDRTAISTAMGKETKTPSE